MFNDLTFRAMQSSLSGLKLKQDTILQNLANLETPGYKAKQVAFENALSEAKDAQSKGSYDFKAIITTDENTEMRPDGNNVDSDKENIALMDTYYQTLALYQKISGRITDLRYVVGQAFK